LEGHTDSGHPQIRPDYGDWEISTDRANAVRRKLLEKGVTLHQIRKVAGFGATVPMPNVDMANEVNRRVTVLLNLKGATL